MCVGWHCKTSNRCSFFFKYVIRQKGRQNVDIDVIFVGISDHLLAFSPISVVRQFQWLRFVLCTLAVTSNTNVSRLPQQNKERNKKQLKSQTIFKFSSTQLSTGNGSGRIRCTRVCALSSLPFQIFPFLAMATRFIVHFSVATPHLVDLFAHKHRHSDTHTLAPFTRKRNHFKIQTACTGFKLNRESYKILDPGFG